MAKPMAPDPLIGTWKLNVAKSSVGVVPAPKSYLVKAEAWEDGINAEIDVVDAEGKTLHVEVSYKFDGKDYPVKGSPLGDAISAKRIDERNSESILKKDGKIVLTVKSVISSDGKTLKQTRTGKDAQDRTVDDVLVFEKQ